MENKKASWGDAFRLNWRAARIWFSQYPNMFYSAAADYGLKTILPYVTIWFSAKIIDELTGNRDPNRLLKLVVLTLIVTTVMALLQAAAHRWFVSQRYTRNGRANKMYADKLLDMDYSVMDRQETYDLLTRVRNSGSWGAWGLVNINGSFEMLMEAVPGILGAMVLSVSMFTAKVPVHGNWLDHLGNPLVVLGVAVLLVALTALSAHLTNHANHIMSIQDRNFALGNRTFNFFGWTIISDRSRALDFRAYRQDKICADYLAGNDGYSWNSVSGKKARGVCGIMWGTARVVDKLFIGVIYGYVCLKAWAGAFGIGSVTQYIAAITALSRSVSLLLELLGRLRNNASYLETTFEFFDLPHEMYQGSLTTEKRSDRQYQVEFRDVSFKYPGSDQWALRHVNMKFEVGRRLAVVGQNGSGKTTFIKLLCRLYDPTEGQILLNGIDIRKYNYQDYLAIFSVVFQDFQLLAFPLGQNVAAAKDYDAARAEDCLRKAGFGDRLDSLPDGLETCLYREFDQKGVEISGGEAQKIAIARALYPDAPFIILDEPTAALDPIAEAEIYSKFDEIAGDKTAIYISHRLSSCRFCDDILVFDQGHVIQQGSHEELVADESGKYHALWHAQAQYYTKA